MSHRFRCIATHQPTGDAALAQGGDGFLALGPQGIGQCGDANGHAVDGNPDSGRAVGGRFILLWRLNAELSQQSGIADGHRVARHLAEDTRTDPHLHGLGLGQRNLFADRFAHRQRQRMLARLLQGGGEAQSSKHGLWHRQGQEYVHINAVQPGGKLIGVTRYQFDEQRKLQAASFARRAQYQGDHWQLEEVKTTLFHDRRTEVQQADRQRWDIELTPQLLGTVVLALIGWGVFGINPLTTIGVLSGGGSPQVQQAPAHRPAGDDQGAKFVSTVLASTEDVWTQIFREGGAQYQNPKLVLFTGVTRTACGTPTPNGATKC